MILIEMVRELSDEEIMKEWKHKYEDTYSDVLIDFARAILAKACNPTIQDNTCKVVTNPTKD
jgi:hypothetical protein